MYWTTIILSTGMEKSIKDLYILHSFFQTKNDKYIALNLINNYWYF